MQLALTEISMLDDLAQKHSGNPLAGLHAAYEAGILEGAIRVARAIGNAAPAASVQGGNDDFEPAGLSSSDAATLARLGIDPTKKFRIRNSVFTITAYKPSRWKFPISAKTQNGTGYKFTIAQLKSYQQA